MADPQHEVQGLRGGAEDYIAKPFDVLAVLMKNKNRTVSRERILNEIWGQDYFGDIRTVDVRIANLRKRLDLGDAIRTVSKAGYRLEER